MNLYQTESVQRATLNGLSVLGETVGIETKSISRFLTMKVLGIRLEDRFIEQRRSLVLDALGHHVEREQCLVVVVSGHEAGDIE
jgi:hypothetical protein